MGKGIKYISLGKEFDYIQAIYYKGEKYINTDYVSAKDENLIALTL